MALTNADGSIVLSTKVDVAGIKKGVALIKKEFTKFETIDFGFLKFQQRLNQISNALNSMLGKLVLASAIRRLIYFSKQAAEVSVQTESSIQRLVDIYGSASDSVGDFIDQNARALGMSKAAAASFSSVYGNLFSVWADQATNAELTNRYLRMTAVVASKTGRTVEDVQERVRSGLLGNTEAIEDLGIFVNIKTIEMTDAFKRMADGKSWEQLDAYTQQQIRSMAILEQATQKYGNQVAQTSATVKNEFNAAYQDFQNSWGRIVNQVLIPALKVLTEVFNIATAGLDALSGRSGKILEDVNIQEETTDETAENIKEQVDAQKDLNKEIKKSLAGFDDIQILSSEINQEQEPKKEFILPEIEETNIEKEANKKVGALMAIAGAGLVALGLLLVSVGSLAWGIGFIIAGAVTLGVTIASLKSDNVSQKAKNSIMKGVIIAGMAAVVIGILLCMAQQWFLGIGLIALGATSMGFAIVVNWDAIEDKLQSFGGWFVLGGAIAIVLGILLCFTPLLPLGIGLIALGAASIVTPIVVNWDAILNKISQTFNNIINWIKQHAMLLIGILLLFTPLSILGLTLIVESIKSEKQGENASWDMLLEKIKDVWQGIKTFWNENIAPIFTKEWWLNLAKKCGNGLIAGFEAGINGIIGMFEKMINWIVNGLNKISFDVPDWVPGIGGKTFGFNIPEVKFGRVSIPRLAKGAVIPPNREFLAVLGDQKQGTNIEAPLQTIVDAFNIALQGNANYGGGNTEVVLEIDGREFGRAVVEQGNRENRRIGTRLVIA